MKGYKLQERRLFRSPQLKLWLTGAVKQSAHTSKNWDSTGAAYNDAKWNQIKVSAHCYRCSPEYFYSDWSPSECPVNWCRTWLIPCCGRHVVLIKTEFLGVSITVSGYFNLFSLMLTSQSFVTLKQVHISYYLSSERLTVPGRGRLSNQRCAGRTHWASCCSRTPSWQVSGGWTQRSSGPPQRAAYRACTRPESTSRNKTRTLWLTLAKRKLFYLIRRITWPTDWF